MSRINNLVINTLDTILRCSTPTLALWEDNYTNKENNNSKKNNTSSTMLYKVVRKMDDMDDEFARA